jgi:hypothetical protein
MTRLARAAYAAFFIAASATMALAQQAPCGPAEQMIGMITSSEKYHEKLMLQGKTESGVPAQIYWDPKNGTATVLLFIRPGVACSVFGGSGMKATRSQIRQAESRGEGVMRQKSQATFFFTVLLGLLLLLAAGWRSQAYAHRLRARPGSIGWGQSCTPIRSSAPIDTHRRQDHLCSEQF